MNEEKAFIREVTHERNALRFWVRCGVEFSWQLPFSAQLCHGLPSLSTSGIRADGARDGYLPLRGSMIMWKKLTFEVDIVEKSKCGVGVPHWLNMGDEKVL